MLCQNSQGSLKMISPDKDFTTNGPPKSDTLMSSERVSLSAEELRGLFDSLVGQYESLFGTKTKLEDDCKKLQEYIEKQVKQIHLLREDLSKLKEDFRVRSANAPNRPQPAEGEAPRPIPASGPPAEEPRESEGEVTNLIPVEQIQHPMVISLLAEIVDVSVVCSTAFNHDGTCLAIGSNKTLRVYDIDGDQFSFEYNLEDSDSEGNNHIRALVWTRDSKILICGGEDGRVRIFHPAEQALVHTIEMEKNNSSGEVLQIAISSDDSFFVVVSGNALTVFKTEDYSMTGQYKMDSDATSVAISPDDKLIAVGYLNHVIVFLNVETLEPVMKKVCHDLGVYGMRFLPEKPDKRQFISASLDNTVKIWDIVTEEDGKPGLKLWKTLDGHSNYVLSIAVDQTGEWLLSGSKDLTARLSSVSQGQMLYSIKSHTNSVITVSFSPTGTMFCTGSGDHAVRIWSMTPEDADDGQ